MVPPEAAEAFGDEMLLQLMAQHGPLCADPAGRRALARGGGHGRPRRGGPAAGARPRDDARSPCCRARRSCSAAPRSRRPRTRPRSPAGSPRRWRASGSQPGPERLMAAAGTLASLRYVFTGRLSDAALARAARGRAGPPDARGGRRRLRPAARRRPRHRAVRRRPAPRRPARPARRARRRPGARRARLDGAAGPVRLSRRLGFHSGLLTRRAGAARRRRAATKKPCAHCAPRMAAKAASRSKPPTRGRALAAASTRPAAQAQPAVHARGELGVVRRDQRRHAGVAHEAEQHVEHPAGGLRVEVAGRLVGEQQPRPVGQRPAERDPLLLAARQLGRTVAGARREPDRGEQVARPRLGGGARDAGGALRQRDVLQRRELRQQVVELVDEADGRRAAAGCARRRRAPRPAGRAPRRRPRSGCRAGPRRAAASTCRRPRAPPAPPPRRRPAPARRRRAPRPRPGAPGL